MKLSGASNVNRLFLHLLLQQLDNFTLLRKSPELVLREYQMAIDVDVKNSVRASNQFRFDR